MKKSIAFTLLALALVGSNSAWAYKSITYNGINCAYRNEPWSAGIDKWVPSTPGLYGFDATVAYCPVDTRPSDGYTFDKLSYAIIYGTNLTNVKLCRRPYSGSTTCGTSASIGGNSWILYKPSGGSSQDLVFLSVNVGSGTSLIRTYAVVWSD